MITSITCKEHPFVLQADRTAPENEKTIFWIVPKTVRGATEMAANYAGVQIENRRSKKKEIDVQAMHNADSKEWLRAVHRIENFGILVGAPGPTEDSSSYDHFLAKSEADPSAYVKDDTGLIVIKNTTDSNDLKYILWAMSPADQEEIMSAYFNYSELKEGLKNA